jgi:hypothetical protein
MRDQVSYRYETKDKIIVFYYILIFTFSHSKREAEVSELRGSKRSLIQSALSFLVNAILI